jgi:hypothetical protein
MHMHGANIVFIAQLKVFCAIIWPFWVFLVPLCSFQSQHESKHFEHYVSSGRFIIQ